MKNVYLCKNQSPLYMNDMCPAAFDLFRCMTSRDYAFVSYSSEDTSFVCRVVAGLQRAGYNLWIVEANLDKSKPSWKSDALRAIEDIYCALVLFFVSSSSLKSRACLDEILHTACAETRTLHLGQEVPLIVVEVEPIQDITDFIAEVARSVRISDKTKEQKTSQMAVVSTFRERWFPDNEKVRIRSEKLHGRRGKLENDIAVQLNNHNVMADDIEWCILALDYVYRHEVKSALKIMDIHKPSVNEGETLMQAARRHSIVGEFRQGLLCYMAEALTCGSGEAYFRAAQCWLRLGRVSEALRCLELSDYKDAHIFYKKLVQLTPEEIRKAVDRLK